MKTPILLSLCLLVEGGFLLRSHAQGTAFTYQGLLQTNGAPFTGTAEVQFTLWDAATNGTQVASSTPSSVIVSVSNGLFTTPVDFGGGVFNGQNRWLQVDLRTTIAPFTALSPRQSLTVAPYALYSAAASMAGIVTGPVPDSLLSSNIARLQSSPAFTGTVSAASFTGSGTGLTGMNHLDSAGGGPAGALTVDSLGHVGIGTNDSGAGLQVAGGTLYSNPQFQMAVTNNSAGITNMSVPVNVFVSGTRAYVTSYSPGAVEIFDISSPLQPVLIGQALDNTINAASPFSKLNGASGIFVTNNIAYVTAENDNALTIMDVSNPANPARLAEVVNGVGGVTNLNTPTGVLVAGHYAYVLGFISSALSVFDVSSPTNPVLVSQIMDDSVQPGSSFTKLQWPYQMTLSGTNLYIAARADSAVTIVSVANPLSPQLVAQIVDVTVNPASPFTGLRNANWVEVVGNVAYVAAGAFNSSLGSLTLIDVSNPSNPVKLAQLDDNVVQTNSPFTKLAGAWGVRVADKTAFVTCSADNALTAIDVSDPTHPRLLRQFVNGGDGITTLNFTEGLTISGDALYVVGDSSSALNVFSRRSTLGLEVAGFVGIGTATPRTALDVAGTVSANSFAATSSVLVDNANANNGALTPGLVFGNTSSEGIASKRTAGGNQYGLDFYTASSPRLSIQNSGRVGIGTTAPVFLLQLAADSAGKPNGGSWANTSDARVKKKILSLTGALDRLAKLRGVTFEWINPEDHANQTTRQGGFIAQEVEQVFPEWVREVPAADHDKDLTDDGSVKSLSLPFEFDALVVEGLRQLRAEKDAQISELQHALSEQKATNARLEVRLSALERAVAGAIDKSTSVHAESGGPLAAK